MSCYSDFKNNPDIIHTTQSDHVTVSLAPDTISPYFNITLLMLF